MMALKVFFAFLVVLFLSGQGYAIDSYCNINVEVAKTGRVVKGSPEFGVVIYSTPICPCNQYDVVLSCDGFSSVVPLKPEVLRKVDGGCLVNNGGKIEGKEDPFKFQYVGTLPTKKFSPVSSEVACP
ncbi:hypothetical protein Vadar_003938 [Vaccinium darrowii]|uniref:Uncharacterized protein n=1 Tax=Vaccinium darrowii TaxID=229202 RepID=A0ACB7YCL1_9ERIC|nr:hypothetical protein Vadar_003938 [Vaccinium darrowii]